jgi:hypothetical protein
MLGSNVRKTRSTHNEARNSSLTSGFWRRVETEFSTKNWFFVQNTGFSNEQATGYTSTTRPWCKPSARPIKRFDKRNFDMASGTRFDADGLPTNMGGEPRGKWSGCIKGCLIVIVILILLAVIGGFLAYQYGRPWFANTMGAAMNQMIDESDLPAEEKAEVKEQVSRVATEFGEGRMTAEQLGRVFENLTESPLMTSIVISVVDQKYLARSGLPEDEKTDARQTIRRFVRGMVDEKIPKESTDAAMQHVATRANRGEWKLKDQVTDEELRAFLAAAKEAADMATIPAEPEDFDPSDEIKKIIDGAMAGN